VSGAALPVFDPRATAAAEVQPPHRAPAARARRAQRATRPPLGLVGAGPLLRRATAEDAAGVHALLEQFVGPGLLLPRSLE
jgi:hypothetical protein